MRQQTPGRLSIRTRTVLPQVNRNHGTAQIAQQFAVCQREESMTRSFSSWYALLAGCVTEISPGWAFSFDDVDGAPKGCGAGCNRLATNLLKQDPGVMEFHPL
jgi:hypothetical protein